MIEFRPLTDDEVRDTAERYSGRNFDMTMVVDDPEKLDLIRHAARARATAHLEEGGIPYEFDQSVAELEPSTTRVFMMRNDGNIYPQLLTNYWQWAHVHDTAETWEQIEARRERACKVADEISAALRTHDTVKEIIGATDFDAFTRNVSYALDNQWGQADRVELSLLGMSLPAEPDSPSAPVPTIPTPRSPEDPMDYFRSFGKLLYHLLKV